MTPTDRRAAVLAVAFLAAVAFTAGGWTAILLAYVGALGWWWRGAHDRDVAARQAQRSHPSQWGWRDE